MVRMLLASPLLLALVASGQDKATSLIQTPETKVHPLEWEHFQLLNKARKEGFTCGDGSVYAPNSKPLKFECRLWRSARAHSLDMMTQNFFSHTSKNGTSPWVRATIHGTTANAENLHAGSSTALGALDSLKLSIGHCRNLMAPKRQVVGIGYAGGAGQYRHYWTQLFRDSFKADDDVSCYPTSSPAPAPTPPATPSPATPSPATPSPAPAPAPAPVAKPSHQSEAAAFMAEINRVRCLHGAPALKWDAKLAANGAADTSRRVVNTSDERNVFFFGVSTWTVERSVDETYKRGASRRGLWGVMYETMLWKATSHIGCGSGVRTQMTCYFRRTSSQGAQVGPKIKTEEQCADGSRSMGSMESIWPLDKEEDEETMAAIDAMELTEADGAGGTPSPDAEGSVGSVDKSCAVGSGARGVVVGLALACAGRFL